MKLEWKDGDAPRLIGAMQILLHLIACYAAGQQPSEEALTVARKWGDELQAICKRPLTGALDALKQAESRLRDREKEIADLCRAWTPPPAEQLPLDFEGGAVITENGQLVEELPAPPLPSEEELGGREDAYGWSHAADCHEEACFGECQADFGRLELMASILNHACTGQNEERVVKAVQEIAGHGYFPGQTAASVQPALDALVTALVVERHGKRLKVVMSGYQGNGASLLRCECNGRPWFVTDGPLLCEGCCAKMAAREGLEEFSPEEQDAAERAQARLAEQVARLEAAMLEAVAACKGSPTVALRIVANQGLGVSPEDRKAVLADLITRGLVEETGTGRSRKVAIAKLPAPCYAGEGGWPGREAIRAAIVEALPSGHHSEDEIVAGVVKALAIPQHEGAVRAEFQRLVNAGELQRREGCAGWWTREELEGLREPAGVARG